MNEHEYPIPVRHFVKTLTGICRHQDKGDLVEILENAHARFEEIDYDNWNRGTYTYRLQLDLPVAIFANHQTKIESLEKEILERVGTIDRSHSNDSVGEVLINPSTDDSNVYGNKFAPSQAETKHLWKAGHFRLFLSHLAEHKVKVHKLKSSLSQYNIDAFVAHDDIQPSREWQNEIELALRSMDSLAALVTLGFIDSKWCDQEIGWALGRGVPVLPIRMNCDPYGFAGKFQAISGSLDNPDRLALSIVKALRSKTATRQAMTKAIVSALANSGSFVNSLELIPYIEEIEEFSDQDKGILWKACRENDQVYRAHNVRAKIYEKIGEPPKTDDELLEDSPF